MVFLDVYDVIWNFLKEEELINKVIDEVEQVFGPKKFSKYDGSQKYADIILEHGLFNYLYDGNLLISYVAGKIENLLDENNKQQFLNLKESKRDNFKYLKKVKLGILDTNGNELYDFYFRDGSGNTKIIVSSARLEEQGKSLSLRLIRNENYKDERYNIIGLICDTKTAENLRGLNQIKKIKSDFERRSEKMKKEVKLDSELISKAVIKLMKRDIFEVYKQTGELTDEDWEFCERIDWHPVDELPLNKESIKELEKRKKGPFIRFNSVEELFKK